MIPQNTLQNILASYDAKAPLEEASTIPAPWYVDARIAELEARSGKPPKAPTNSSLPPSSGQKANVADASGRKKGRKGRPGVARELCPNPDVTRDIYAERCACGAELSHTGQVLAHAYDHVELPPIKPITTRVNLHRADCPCCKKSVTAEPPADMPSGSPFGPGIVALVTYLHGCQMVSYARLAEMLDGLFGLKISEGAIANMLARVAEPFAECAEAIHDTVRNSPVIASDETSARVKGPRQRKDVLAMGIRRSDGRRPRNHTDPRQDRADPVPQRGEARGVALRSSPGAVQSRRGTPGLPRPFDP